MCFTSDEAQTIFVALQTGLEIFARILDGLSIKHPRASRAFQIISTNGAARGGAQRIYKAQTFLLVLVRRTSHPTRIHPVGTFNPETSDRLAAGNLTPLSGVL